MATDRLAPDHDGGMSDMRRLRYTVQQRGALFGRLLWCDRLGYHKWHEPESEEWRICVRCGQSELLDWDDLGTRLRNGEAIPLSYNMLVKALSVEGVGRAVEEAKR